MLLVTPFSKGFWIFYLCGGVTDVIDGFVARKLNQQGAIGAKLDSIADSVFAIAIAAIIIVNIEIPIWLWLAILWIALLRFVGYGIGFYKYHTFTSLHTYANKATGALIFVSPIFYALLGLSATGAILCAVALVATFEEVFITVKSNTLDRDCKSIFTR